jgi:hypothetical protein
MIVTRGRAAPRADDGASIKGKWWSVDLDERPFALDQRTPHRPAPVLPYADCYPRPVWMNRRSPTYRHLVAWFAGAAAIGCMIVGLLHLHRLLTVPAGRVGEVSAAAAALGMAAMLSPLGDPVPLPAWIAVFGGCAAWTVLLAARARALDGDGDAAHHLLCSAAMVFMLVGHGAHSAGPVVVSVIALVAAGYFTWHGLRCVDRFRNARTGHPRTVAGAHIISAVAMSGMLVAMI